MNAQRGFTIIELVMTIALAAVILGLGVPNMQSFVETNKTATDTNSFVTALNVARSEAVSRSRAVSLVPLTVNDWSKGWRVGIDTDFNLANGVETIIQTWGEGLRNAVLVDDLADEGLSFLPNGGIAETAAADGEPTFGLTPTKCTNVNQIRRISVKLSGLIDLQTLACP